MIFHSLWIHAICLPSLKQRGLSSGRGVSVGIIPAMSGKMDIPSVNQSVVVEGE
jgi:hypothetical protein